MNPCIGCPCHEHQCHESGFAATRCDAWSKWVTEMVIFRGEVKEARKRIRTDALPNVIGLAEAIGRIKFER